MCHYRTLPTARPRATEYVKVLSQHRTTAHRTSPRSTSRERKEKLGLVSIPSYSHLGSDRKFCVDVELTLSYPVNTNPTFITRGQKLLNYRVENIAESITWDNVKDLFKPEERPWIQVRSLAAARFSGLGSSYKTATIEFSCPPDSPNQAPQLDQPPPLVVDKTFEGFTSLNEPTRPIVAE